MAWQPMEAHFIRARSGRDMYKVEEYCPCFENLKQFFVIGIQDSLELVWNFNTKAEL